jgi:hypothetical protein
MKSPDGFGYIRFLGDREAVNSQTKRLDRILVHRSAEIESATLRGGINRKCRKKLATPAPHSTAGTAAAAPPVAISYADPEITTGGPSCLSKSMWPILVSKMMGGKVVGQVFNLPSITRQVENLPHAAFPGNCHRGLRGHREEAFLNFSVPSVLSAAKCIFQAKMVREMAACSLNRASRPPIRLADECIPTNQAS